MVEASCEKALFASPEASAAAVSYVAAQLALLADAARYAQRADPRYEAVVGSLRRAIENDRFGIVAHVLSAHEGCTLTECRAFALLQDISRVKQHMAEAAYEGYIGQRSADWTASSTVPAVASAPPAGTAVAIHTPPGELFLPSSDSIPAVNIMNAEPPSPEREAAAARPQSPSARARTQNASSPRAPAERNAAAGTASPVTAPQ
jgi:hypothetical protein